MIRLHVKMLRPDMDHDQIRKAVKIRWHYLRNKGAFKAQVCRCGADGCAYPTSHDIASHTALIEFFCQRCAVARGIQKKGEAGFFKPRIKV